MEKIFIALLSLCFLSLAWDTPKLLEADYNSSSTGIYYDEFSKRLFTRYFRWKTINTQDPEVESGTKPYNQDKTLGKFSPIAIQKIRDDHYFGTLAGTDKGKVIFSIDNFATHRVMFDICFSESLDHGETWSEPVFVPRPNMNDLIHRVYPSFVYIKETRRIYIFYVKLDFGGKVSNMYVTRAPDSKIFSNEREIKLPNLKETIVSATYNLKNNMPLIHIVWIEEDKLWYSNSFDALKWSEPRSVLQNIRGDVSSKLIAGKNNELFYSFVGRKSLDHQKKDGLGIHIIFTENPEGKWNTPVTMIDGGCVNPGIAYCIDPKGDESIFAVKMETQKIRISQFKSNTKEVKEFDKPLEKCANRNQAHIACAYNTRIQKYNVYVTYDDFISSSGNIGAYVTMENIPQ